MKFTTSENKTFRQGVGYVPKYWIEYAEFDKTDYNCSDDTFDFYRKCIVKYFYDEIKHWDYDEGGDETHDFVFEDGKAFRLEYSYWSEWHHEDDEENGLKSEYYIIEIDIDKVDVPEKRIGRDWL